MPNWLLRAINSNEFLFSAIVFKSVYLYLQDVGNFVTLVTGEADLPYRLSRDDHEGWWANGEVFACDTGRHTKAEWRPAEENGDVESELHPPHTRSWSSLQSHLEVKRTENTNGVLRSSDTHYRVMAVSRHFHLPLNGWRHQRLFIRDLLWVLNATSCSRFLLIRNQTYISSVEKKIYDHIFKGMHPQMIRRWSVT